MMFKFIAKLLAKSGQYLITLSAKVVTPPLHNQRNIQTVGVITASQHVFNSWVRFYRQPNEVYVRIYDSLSVHGRTFDRLEKVYNWREVDSYVIMEAITNLKVKEY